MTEWSTETLLYITELIQIKYEFQIENNRILKLPKQIMHNTNDTPSDSITEYHTIDFNIIETETENQNSNSLQNSSTVE